MDDLISRKAAIEVIDKIFPADPMRNDYTQGITCGAALATEYIKQLPSAQPEIVRCKDCKHRIEHKHYGDLGESAYTCEGNMAGWILPDGFCSYAERRTDG